MFELRKSRLYRPFPVPSFPTPVWSLQVSPALPCKPLHQYCIRSTLVFQCFSAASVQTYEAEEGLYMLPATCFAFASWDCQVILVKPRKRVQRLIRASDGQLFGLSKDAIYLISGKEKGLVKRLCRVPKLLEQLPAGRNLTSAALFKDFFFLSTAQKLFILSVPSGKVIQSLLIFEGIQSIHIVDGKVMVSTLESQFEVSDLTQSEQSAQPKPPPIQLDPETIIALDRVQSFHPEDPLEVLWTGRKRTLQQLKSLWRLDPLDRAYLHSKDFYQEHLFAYMDSVVKVTALVLYLEEPASLRLLREALREQETNLRQDGLLRAGESISSFILACLPPVTAEDQAEQRAIREELESKNLPRSDPLAHSL